MNLSEIQKYHTLTEMVVSPVSLLLDPTNPRINVGDSITYSEEELSKESVQLEILHRINKKEHHIADLIAGIKSSGFIPSLSTFIVKGVPGTGKYLVLEGNRRTTALKQLLINSDDLNSEVLESIKRVKVQRFDYVSNPYFSEEEIIDIILGKIHMTGPLAWGAMEKANYIHNTYLRELKKALGSEYMERYQHNSLALKRTTDFFDFKRSDIVKNLKIYNVFSQLRSAGYNPENDRYSLLELAVGDKDISQGYFGLDNHFNFSEVGLERFNNLCLDGSPAKIRNPQNMKDFITIYKRGNKDDIYAVEAGLITVEEVAQGLRKRQNKNNFSKKLKDIKRKLENLNLCEFTNSKEEKAVTLEIIKILNEKVIPLFSSEPALPKKKVSHTNNNIHSIIGMNSIELKRTIVETIGSCPNHSCTKDSLVTKILRSLNIHTRGKPRKNFEDRVERELALLVNEGEVKVYRAKNIRLKVA